MFQLSSKCEVNYFAPKHIPIGSELGQWCLQVGTSARRTKVNPNNVLVSSKLGQPCPEIRGEAKIVHPPAPVGSQIERTLH